MVPWPSTHGLASNPSLLGQCAAKQHAEDGEGQANFELTDRWH